jgi:hypothetical protein
MSQTTTEMEARAAAPSPPVQLQTCFNLIGRVEDQLRFADSKSAFIATLHAFLIGPLAANVPAIRNAVAPWDMASHGLLWLTAGAYAVMFLASMTAVALTVLPRKPRHKRPGSRAFFGRIAREYGHDPDRYVAELAAMSCDDWLAELGKYLVEASDIAATKHRMARWATVLAVPTVASWMLVVLVLLYGGSSGR